MATWISDTNGNRCSVEYFGSEEAARKALESLTECENCTNCSRCSGCSGCSYCSYCSGCSNVAWLYDKNNLRGDLDKTYSGPPPVPKIENIHQRVLEAASAPGSLAMDRWHTCGTTHCRAGWVVHLAGEAGYALERFHNTALAAQLIYREICPEMPVAPTRFYETDEQALADMRRLAEIEAGGAS